MTEDEAKQALWDHCKRFLRVVPTGWYDPAVRVETFVEGVRAILNQEDHRYQRLSEMRANAIAGGYTPRTFEEISATVDHSLPEDPQVEEWMNDPDVGRELL